MDANFDDHIWTDQNEKEEKEHAKNIDSVSQDVEAGNALQVDESEDSEEEVEINTGKRRISNSVLNLPDDLTEEEINGDFPLFKTSQMSDDSSDDDLAHKKDAIVEKPNPYLAHINSNETKYSDKLRELHLKRNEARKLNHQEVSAEDQRKKLPANYEARRKRAEWELADQNARKAAEEAGEDYDKVKLLEETADEVEIYENRKRKKKNMDPGFSDYAAAQLRQYDGLTKKIKPNMVVYDYEKSKLGESAFPSAHNLMYGGSGKCSEAAIDRMVGDLEKQIEKRGKFHRRRQHHDESDINYINEKNMKFNQKADRFYGQYTKEIRENLERGTAI